MNSENISIMATVDKYLKMKESKEQEGVWEFKSPFSKNGRGWCYAIENKVVVVDDDNTTHLDPIGFIMKYENIKSEEDAFKIADESGLVGTRYYQDENGKWG